MASEYGIAADEIGATGRSDMNRNGRKQSPRQPDMVVAQGTASSESGRDELRQVNDAQKTERMSCALVNAHPHHGHAISSP